MDGIIEVKACPGVLYRAGFTCSERTSSRPLTRSLKPYEWTADTVSSVSGCLTNFFERICHRLKKLPQASDMASSCPNFCTLVLDTHSVRNPENCLDRTVTCLV